MKLNTDIHRDKPSSLEADPMKHHSMIEIPIDGTKKSSSYDRCMQFMKVILYLELIVFVGWMGCILLTYYYQGNRCNNAEGPKWKQSQQSQGSLIDGNSISVRDNKWSPTGDDSNIVVQRSESPTDSVLIDEKNDSITIEPTTITSVIETNDKNMDGAMLFSAWLDAIQGSRKNWEDSRLDLDSSASKITSSDEESNNGSKSSPSQEIITLIEGSDNPSSGSSIVGRSNIVAKRSIKHPDLTRPYNTLNLDDKILTVGDDTESFEMMNLNLDGQPSEQMFFDKMEILASHIDRLQEIYRKYNGLNDDYVSKELPIDSLLNYEY